MKPRSSSMRVVGVLTLALSAAAAEAASQGPKRRLDESLGLSVNQLGLQHVLHLRWVWSRTASKNPLLGNAHVSAGLSHYITPSYTRLGAWVELPTPRAAPRRTPSGRGAPRGARGSDETGLL